MTTRWTDREQDTRRAYNRHLDRYGVAEIVYAALILAALLVLGGMR